MMSVYGTYAAGIAASVHNDVLLAEDRMPSVRQVSASASAGLRVSPSTVSQAH